MWLDRCKCEEKMVFQLYVVSYVLKMCTMVCVWMNYCVFMYICVHIGPGFHVYKFRPVYRDIFQLETLDPSQRHDGMIHILSNRNRV